MVVLAGGWCYVRELVMPYYAEAFADAGVAALVFDYQNLGVSDGDVRQHLDPWLQIRDYQNALSYLESRDDVDAERLGAWGISYSGGHVLILAAIDPRVRAIVSQIPVIDGYHNMRRVHGTMGYRKLWDLILQDRRNRYADPATRLYIPHATAEPDRDLSTWPFPETYATFKMLKEREAPLYENRSTVESVDLLLNYDVMPFVRRIYDTPTLMIVASGDDLTLWDLEIAAYNALPTTDRKLNVLPHTTHMTLYSDRAKLDIAAAAATEWFASRAQLRLNVSRGSAGSPSCVEDPGELPLHVLDDVASLELRWEDVPGVRLDLHLIRQRYGAMLGQRLGDGEPRRAEAVEIVEEHRDVEVSAPLRRLTRLPARHRVTKVQEAADRPVAASFHRLAEIDGLGELPELLDDFGVTSGTRIAAATCSLTIGTSASTRASRLAPTSSNSTAWWQMSKTTPRWARSAAAASASSMPRAPPASPPRPR